jgi:GTPase SAR1 family protein
VCIYSVTDRGSFLEACRLKDNIIKIKGTETPVVLVANKCDMLTARCVTEDDGASLAAQLDCPKFDISVADGYQGVSDAMEELLIQLKRDFIKSLTTANAQSGEKPRSKLFNMRKVLKKRIGRSHSDTF